MTNYAVGFLSKCASAGVPQEAAFYMLKLAQTYQYAKPGFNIFGQPLAAPTPTEQQKADARAAGVSQPATVMPKPVSRRQTPASSFGAPDPVKPGNNTGLTSSPSKAGVTAPAKPASTVPTFGQQPKQDNSGNYDDFQLPDNLEVTTSNPAQPPSTPSVPSAKTYNTARAAVQQGENSWAGYGYDPNNPRMKQMAGGDTGPYSAPKPTVYKSIAKTPSKPSASAAPAAAAAKAPKSSPSTVTRPATVTTTKTPNGTLTRRVGLVRPGQAGNDPALQSAYDRIEALRRKKLTGG